MQLQSRSLVHPVGAVEAWVRHPGPWYRPNCSPSEAGASVVGRSSGSLAVEPDAGWGSAGGALTAAAQSDDDAWGVGKGNRN
jgi:hypothetical protein